MAWKLARPLELPLAWKLARPLELALAWKLPWALELPLAWKLAGRRSGGRWVLGLNGPRLGLPPLALTYRLPLGYRSALTWGLPPSSRLTFRGGRGRGGG
ncbi:MAG: hypothetical protein LBJ61_07170 [Deltaproteobacteria bacterium]|nr:hypothetical protein [Deltaproteobacteria bacterium]